MRIAYLSYWSCPRSPLGKLSSGGMNVYLLNLARALDVCGHHIDIFTRNHTHQSRRISNLNPRVRLIHLDAHGRNHPDKSLGFAAAFLDFIKKNSLKYDILHAHYYYSAYAGLYLAGKTGIPLAITFHTLGEMKKKYAGIADPIRIALEKKVVQQAAALIASTELEKKELTDYYGANPDVIHVVPPSVDRRLFRPGDKHVLRSKLNLPRHKKIILFVGRIDPVKSIALLIEAVGQLFSLQADYRRSVSVLLIGGDIQSHNFWRHPEVKKIKAAIKKQNLEDSVCFLGAIAHKMLPHYYTAADIVVLPSVYESFGLVILEAMACGSPVIASRVGGLKYLIKNNHSGLLFQSGRAADLAVKIRNLLSDPDKMQSLASNALSESRRYSPGSQADKIIRIYKSLI